MALSRRQRPEIPEEGKGYNAKLTTIDRVGGILCHICQLTLPNKKQYDDHYASHNTNVKDIVYTCVVCMKPFESYPIFRGHCYVKHVTKDKFKCKHCGRNYSRQCVLLNHIKTVHNFECIVCSERFLAKEELQIHQLVHTKKEDKLQHICNCCGKKIYNIDMCEQHIDEVSVIKFPCPMCDDVLPTKAAATEHVAKHFNKNNFNNNDNAVNNEEPCFTEDSSVDILGILCFYCSTVFKNRSEIDVHILNEHENEAIVYTCNVCHKEYEAGKYINFLNHCYFHLTRNKFECTECGKTFPRLSLFVMHTEAFHSYAGSTKCEKHYDHKPFECSYCIDAFKTSCGLVRHLHQEHGMRAIQCMEDDCSEIFESLKEFILHQRKHSSVTKKSCRFCGLRFVSLVACTNHIEIHRIKNYGCPICNKDYKERYALVKHIPCHFEGVLHICKICGKSYNLKSRLVQHNKIHNEVKTYKCTFCGKAFFTASNLQQHQNIHTGMRPYKCMICPKTFAAPSNWSKHLRRIHDVDVKKQKINAKEHQINAVLKTKEVKVNKPVAPEKTADNQNVKEIDIEDRIDLPYSETSLEMYSMLESDESSMDSIASSTLEREMEIIDSNISNLEGDLSDLLSSTDNFIDDESTLLESSEPATYPVELGPDFVNTDTYSPTGEYINLDDNVMPYIDPLLTIKQANGQNENTNYNNYTNIDTNVDQPINGNVDNNVSWQPSVYTYNPDMYRDGLTGVNLLATTQTNTF